MRGAIYWLVMAGLVGCGDEAGSPKAPEGAVLLTNGPLAVTTAEDTAVVFFAPRTPSVTRGPAHGTTTIDGTAVIYTPAQDYDGDDTLSIAFSNGSTNSVAAITVTTTPVNDAPVAHDIVYDLGTMMLSVDAANGLLKHATDVDSTTLTAALGVAEGRATVTVTPDGGFTYVLADVSNDGFTYTVSDGELTSAPGMVSFRLIPVATDDAYAATVDVPLAIDAAHGLLANDTSIADQDLGVSTLSSTKHGSLLLAGDGSFTYTATTSVSPTDTFTYLATQRDGASASATVTFTISP